MGGIEGPLLNLLHDLSSYVWLHEEWEEEECLDFQQLLGSFNLIIEVQGAKPLWLPIQGASAHTQDLHWWSSSEADGSTGKIYTSFASNLLPKMIECIVVQLPRRVVHFIWRGDYEPVTASIRGRILAKDPRKWARNVLLNSQRSGPYRG